MEKIWLKHYPAGVPHEIDPNEHPSVVALFEQSVRNFGARPAFSNGDTTLCFSELDVLACDFGAYLQQARGIKKQDCVAIMLPNLVQFPIALLGALRVGARVTNINPLYTQDELEHQLNDAGAKAMVIHGDSLPSLQQIRNHTPIEIIIIAPSGDLPSTRAGEPGEGIGDQFAAAWGQKETTREVTTSDGFLKTADLARMDEKGYFYLVDRKKDWKRGWAYAKECWSPRVLECPMSNQGKR